MMSDFKCGDHITELYSSIGLTYTTKAQTNILMSPDVKQRRMQLAVCSAF